MTDFAKLYVPRCKDCSFYQPCQWSRASRHYCQLKIQMGKQGKEALVHKMQCVCERFIDKRI